MKTLLEGLGMLIIYCTARFFGNSTIAEGYIIMLLFMIVLILSEIRNDNCTKEVGGEK